MTRRWVLLNEGGRRCPQGGVIAARRCATASWAGFGCSGALDSPERRRMSSDPRQDDLPDARELKRQRILPAGSLSDGCPRFNARLRSGFHVFEICRIHHWICFLPSSSGFAAGPSSDGDSSVVRRRRSRNRARPSIDHRGFSMVVAGLFPHSSAPFGGRRRWIRPSLPLAGRDVRNSREPLLR